MFFYPSSSNISNNGEAKEGEEEHSSYRWWGGHYLMYSYFCSCNYDLLLLCSNWKLASYKSVWFNVNEHQPFYIRVRAHTHKLDCVGFPNSLHLDTPLFSHPRFVYHILVTFHTFETWIYLISMTHQDLVAPYKRKLIT